MSNADFNDDVNKRRQSSKGGRDKKPGKHSTIREATASWGGLMGKAGPNRSGGVKKLKEHPKSEGI